MSEETFVEASHVGRTFPNGIQALHDLNFRLVKGEFAAIVGPSGCGKSTLLRLLAGLDTSFQGTLTIAGAPPARALRDGRSVAFVFQQPNLLPWRNVARNVMLPLELAGGESHSWSDRVGKVLELVGLTGFAGVYPHQLSGGMQMRASVARALVTRPGLLLMDEPFAALDEITRQSLHEELLRLWASQAFTTAFVTHNMFEAVFLARRVLVMSSRPGRFVAEVQVPFPYPRDPDLRGDAGFARIVGEVSRCLRHGPG